MRDTLRQERVRGDACPQGYPTCHHMEHRPPHCMVACVTAYRTPLVVRMCTSSNPGRGVRPPSTVITGCECRARYYTTVVCFSQSLAVSVRALRCVCPSAVGRCPHRAPARLAQTRLC